MNGSAAAGAAFSAQAEQLLAIASAVSTLKGRTAWATASFSSAEWTSVPGTAHSWRTSSSARW